jgi:hypothetical protein
MASGTIKNYANDSDMGYCKMPDGTLIQWGVADNTADGYAEITFPQAFVNRNYAILGTPRHGPGHTSLDYFAIISASTVSSAIAYFRKATDATPDLDTTAEISWFAVGRWKY